MPLWKVLRWKLKPCDAALCFEILGPVRAWAGSQELDLGPAKQRAVLAVLLIHANKPVQPARIVEDVWGQDQPANGANVVQKYVSGLRRVLEPYRTPRAPGQLLTLTNAGYLLRIEPGCLDVEVFRGLVGQARAARAAGDLATASDRLARANALWRSEALAGLTEAGLEAVRSALDEMRVSGLEEWAEAELELGRHGRLVPELVRLVVGYPMRERLRCLHMLALYRCGRQAEAHTAYRDARAFLIDEYGVEPGQGLQRLHQRMLQNDPALDWRDRTGPLASFTPPVQQASWTPPPGQLASRPQTPPGMLPPAAAAGPSPYRWVGRLLVVAVPLLSLGLATWAVFAFLAGRRRTPGTILAAVSYFAMFATVMIASGFTSDPPGDAEPALIIEMLALAVSMLGGAMHGALVSLDTARDDRHYAFGGPMRPDPLARAGRVVAIAVPLLSFGFLTWVVVAAYAGLRRSAALGVAAFGYLASVALTFFLYATDADSTPLPEGWNTVVLLAVFVNVIGGCAHVAFVSSPHYRPAGVVPGAPRAAMINQWSSRSPSSPAAAGVSAPPLQPIWPGPVTPSS